MRHALLIAIASALSCGGHQTAPPASAEGVLEGAVIYHNAQVHTLDPENPTATGLRVEGGQIFLVTRYLSLVPSSIKNRTQQNAVYSSSSAQQQN